MIIPIRCMSCGSLIADKWRYYSERLKKLRGSNKPSDRFYMDGTQIQQTPEMGVMLKLGMKRPCCRKHFLTHCDLIEKI